MKHRIRFLSDLHLEFILPNKIKSFISKIPPGIDEICVLAGDIGNPYESNYNIFMEFISRNFKKGFVIAGNHEYYNKSKTIEETNIFLKDYFKRFNNISFLDNSHEKYEDLCFIGTTLWSKITNPIHEINDVKYIPNFDYIKYNKLNILCVDFLEEILENNENCIIITHHMPLESLIDNKYKTPHMIPYNQWFYCDMQHIIEKNKNKIKCWIYGHTHMASNIIIDDIQFLCNPIGYPGENSNIDLGSSVEIGN